ncbi:hypothetical protein M407DRAFT_245961 [Tulasnella calospora MUT 4182]|uniref:Uncharacterized protein n=1 Tax=Tulasnella calospora MUT 4182 TaxID=1051891 RepID=A0A0C3KEZ7_9AGAM|nr:hypothetical protein M407DRAFT_245961 [Tulasnella calospora MUT 4182]
MTLSHTYRAGSFSTRPSRKWKNSRLFLRPYHDITKPCHSLGERAPLSTMILATLVVSLHQNNAQKI